jgi:Site-specific recombinase XerD
MINRENWLDIKEYLNYLGRVKQLDEKTIHRRREQLTHLLEWADDILFNQCREIDPTFPVYLQTSRRDGEEKALSASTMKATCSVVRGFFEWARQEMPRKYSKISASWIETIHPSKAYSVHSEVKTHEFFPLEEIVRIARLPVKTLYEERAQAIVCLGYLSAMRADALVTLPISCINVAAKTIDQYPSSGVRTKNHKARQTYILPLPEIYDIVKAWDDKVRSLLPENSMWCATIDRRGENLVPEYRPSEGRRQILEKSLAVMCEMAGLKYRNPHQLRHGFTVYGVKRAKTLKDLKAISQNLMHENVGTTDRIYAELTGDDVQSVIDSLVDGPHSDFIDLGGLDIEGLKSLQKVLKEHPGLLDALK